MNARALGTLLRADKGAIKPPPALPGTLDEVARAVGTWSGVTATAHWHLYDRSRIDGIDFYVGDEELGHMHLDGSLHVATSSALGKALVDEGLARPFPYQRGWVCADVELIGAAASIALFQRNYEEIQSVVATAP